ncbi:MAG TPA: hypothetical protein VGD35_03135, partial [Chitinophaga sp.]
MNTTVRFLTCALLGLLFTTRVSYAQDETSLTHNAPSLQIGLNGLQFSRGTLDAELIMQIVAEKQREVGLKVVQNMFLSKMSDAGGAFYSFTDNIIRGVVAERDIDVITRKLLENTVNITFTYAFADYYLRTLPESSLNNINALATARRISRPYTAAEIRLGLAGLKSTLPADNTDQLVVENLQETSLIALMADISSEVIRNNAVLKELGIMQVSYSQSYEYLNKYLKLKREKPAEFAFAETIYKDMEQQLNHYTSMIGLLYYHLQANSYRLNVNNVLKNLSGKTAISSIGELGSKLTQVNADMKVITTSLQGLLNAVATDTVKFRKLYAALEDLQGIKNYLYKAEEYFTAAGDKALEPATASSQKLGINADIIYTLYADIIPKLQTIGIWNGEADKSIR